MKPKTFLNGINGALPATEFRAKKIDTPPKKL
jgi:hypothetical protein